MPESFDFSKMAKIAPRADSWDKVVARIQAKKARKILPFRLFSSLSVAASLFLIAGALFLGLQANANLITPSTSATDSTENLSWYSELGSGEAVDSFSTPIDNYFK